MSRSRKDNSSKTQEEAMAIAKGTQKPGQTKEQTRLIAQGIQKGIEQYKKQHKAKMRELDKQKKKNPRSQAENALSEPEITSPDVIYKQHWLPWLLLVVSWVGFAAFTFLSK
ncbi:DUF2956 domain-containing protein [Sansalvadorimonas sp. 2012CJ34-2]|uniref:DUF2956 domain-containing protein n=1 Tax=Parendozoicomonas callyspongiae TaxID=2942213 RepID=A0ABT0PEH2_9GAMM|nr:DUF2956 domain-containing protein [Sansalvadorimonas sp. 2012CJ34-2]MCL6269772.1 DUF2956 domain-containing protein [Sansalvadorimonas sp. 2012CJ34-2]